MDKVNALDFVMFDPVEAGEMWAVEGGSAHKVVEILIDGRRMAEIIEEIERPYIEEDPTIEDDAEQYGHVSPKSLYDDLMEAAEPLYDSELGVYLYWYDFQHEHRDWSYHLTFRFHKDAYEQAMRKLKRMSQQHAL